MLSWAIYTEHYFIAKNKPATSACAPPRLCFFLYHSPITETMFWAMLRRKLRWRAQLPNCSFSARNLCSCANEFLFYAYIMNSRPAAFAETCCTATSLFVSCWRSKTVGNSSGHVQNFFSCASHVPPHHAARQWLRRMPPVCAR